MGKCLFLRKGEIHTAPTTEEEVLVPITADNISSYFTVRNGTYYFKGSGSAFATTNSNEDSTTASTTLTAKQDIIELIFVYSWSTEEDYDRFTLKVANSIVENAVSGPYTIKTYYGSLMAGQKIEFTYSKDDNNSKYNDKCTFSNMFIRIKQRKGYYNG